MTTPPPSQPGELAASLYRLWQCKQLWKLVCCCSGSLVMATQKSCDTMLVKARCQLQGGTFEPTGAADVYAAASHSVSLCTSHFRPKKNSVQQHTLNDYGRKHQYASRNLVKDDEFTAYRQQGSCSRRYPMLVPSISTDPTHCVQ